MLTEFFRWSANSLPVETLTLPSPHRVRSSPPRISIQANTGLVGYSRRAENPRSAHTAACLWLARGVDPVTVQTWMGHASIATTNLYLHHLGTAADKAGLARLNSRGYAGGTHKQAESE